MSSKGTSESEWYIKHKVPMAKHPINAKVMGSISQEHTHNVVCQVKVKCINV